MSATIASESRHSACRTPFLGLSAVVGVSYGRHVVDVVRTDDFDLWLRKLKDRGGSAADRRTSRPVGCGQSRRCRTGRAGSLGASIEVRSGYRVYYLHDGPRVILLLCGGDRATQQRDIERACQLAEDYRSEEGRNHG
ncbi:MAG: type II toxin-antitoxin system RelE/ParE family toxin [Candidatus Nanopelagicales bacterium]